MSTAQSAAEHRYIRSGTTRTPWHASLPLPLTGQQRLNNARKHANDHHGDHDHRQRTETLSAVALGALLKVGRDPLGAVGAAPLLIASALLAVLRPAWIVDHPRTVLAAIALVSIGMALALVRPDPQLAVRAVLSRPWNASNGRVEFRPIVPLTGKLGGQFDFVYAMVSTQDAGARADYAQFAPVAAEMNVLREVERRRFEAAFAARESRLKLGRQVRLFMPVLADTLLDESWLESTLSSMRERKLSGTGLTLELSSRDLLDRRDALAPVLQRLRQLGIRVGLSDYGMDWAAVHVLSTLTVDFLRLDPELVTHTTSDKAVSTTLLALVRKAHQLGAAVLAPNVESIDRAHVLLRLGIDYGIGDGLARPLAEPEFDFNRPIW